VSDKSIIKTAIRKIFEKVEEDLRAIDIEDAPQKLMDYYIGIENITQKTKG